MTARPVPGFARVQFLDEAVADMRRLAEASPAMLLEVLRALKQLDRGERSPVALRDFLKTGDLSDCGKIVVTAPDEPEHRIVVRSVDGGFEISEVVVVAERTGDLPYLLAALRLSRVDDPVRRSDAARRIDRIRRSRDA